MAVISEEAKKSRAAYMREYRKRNKERISEINARYWENRARREEKCNAEKAAVQS